MERFRLRITDGELKRAAFAAAREGADDGPVAGDRVLDRAFKDDGTAAVGASNSMCTLKIGGMPVVEFWPSGAGLPGVMSITADLSGIAFGPGLIVPGDALARPTS